MPKTSKYVFTNTTEGKSAKRLYLSDVHFDSPHCDRDLVTKLLKQAQKEEARVYIIGDLYDVMGTQKDPRSGKGDIRPEYNVANYLDAVHEDSVEFFRPYADVIDFVSEGNHEHAMRKFQETDMIARLCYVLKHLGHTVEYMPYGGWVMEKIEKGTKGCYQKRHVTKYNHGSSGGRRSKGMLNVDIRQAHWVADMYVSGHLHDPWIKPMVRESLSPNTFDVVRSNIWHIQLGSMKAGHDYFTLSREFNAQFKSAAWVDITVKSTGNERVLDVMPTFAV